MNTLKSLPTCVNPKTYYLIFREGSPPSITESWKAAEYWKRQGCTVETYHRTGEPKCEL